MPYRTELKRPDLKGRFPCSVCGKVFCHSSSLSRHRMQAHFKSYTCTQCNMEISSSETLRTHMVNSHAVSRLFMCRCCNWAFSDKTTLHIHMQSMSRSGQPGDVLVLAKSSVEGDSSFIDYDGGSPSSSPHENDASIYLPSPDNNTSADLSLNSKSSPAVGNSLGSAAKSLFPADFLNALNGSGGANSMLNKLSAQLLAVSGAAGSTQQQQNGTIFPNGNGMAAASQSQPSQQLNRLDLLKKFRENSSSTAYEDSPVDPNRALMNMLNNTMSTSSSTAATTSSNSLLTAAQAPPPSATTSQATTAHNQLLMTWLANNPFCAKALLNESSKLCSTNASSNEGKTALIAAAAAAMSASRGGGNPPPPTNNGAGSTSQLLSEFNRLLAASQPQSPSATLTPPTKRSRLSANSQPSAAKDSLLFDAEALKLRIATGGHQVGRSVGGGMSSSGALSSTSSTTTTSSTSDHSLQNNKQRRSTTPTGKLSTVIDNILSVCGGADDVSTDLSLFDMAAQAHATDNESTERGRRNKRKARVPQQLTPQLASINYHQEPTKRETRGHNFLPASKSSALDGFANNLAAQKQQQGGGLLTTSATASVQTAADHHYEQPSPTVSDSQTNETSGSCGGGGATTIASSAKKCAGCQELSSKLQLCEARVKELEEALSAEQQQPPRSASQEVMEEGEEEEEEGVNDAEGVTNALLATVAAAITGGGGGVEEEEAESGEENEELVSSGSPLSMSVIMKNVKMSDEKFPLVKKSTILEEENCQVKKEEDGAEDEAKQQLHA